MSEWKILKQETVRLDDNNFIEVSLKEPPGKDDILIAISKGWFVNEDEKRYKTNILFSKDKKQEVIDILSKIDEN